MVWIVDPDKRKVTVHTVPDQEREFVEDDTLDGGDVLPGFELSLRERFARVPRSLSPRRKKKPGAKGKKGRRKRET